MENYIGLTTLTALSTLTTAAATTTATTAATSAATGGGDKTVEGWVSLGRGGGRKKEEEEEEEEEGRVNIAWYIKGEEGGKKRRI